jgi:MFS family permease
MAISFLEAAMPLWMIETMNDPPAWQLGLALLPVSLSYMIGAYAFGRIGHKLGRLLILVTKTCDIIFLYAPSILHHSRWLCCVVALILLAVSLFFVSIFNEFLRKHTPYSNQCF